MRKLFDAIDFEEELKDKKSKIKIDHEHDGEFTKWCKEKGYTKVTCKCIEDGKKSDDPHVRKMANFAYNFGWKRHGKKCKNLEK